MRYRAFFSYARADDSIANWLHRQLDHYRTPRALAGVDGELGPVPTKLHPIFRDRTDLEAGGHVDAALQAALEESETLVVLCTPTSAKSRWVNHECETFLRLGREARIFPVIAAGEPESGDTNECFPPALKGRGLLAADLREIRLPNGQLVGDGKEGGRLKLISGLLGVPLDRLVQRERKRQRQAMAVLSAAALVFLGVAAVAAGFWWVSEQRSRTIASQSNEIVKERDLAKANERRAVKGETNARTAQALAEQKEAEARRARDGEALQRAIAAKNAQDALAKAREAIAAREMAEKAQAEEKELRERATAALEDVVLRMQSAWPSDEASPDYRHLTADESYAGTVGREFRVDQAVLQRALANNAFTPRPINGQVVIAVRGASVVAADAESFRWVALKDVRPDHRLLRCVILTLDTTSGALRAFPGTTVPSDPYLRTQFTGQLDDQGRAHLLPTGIYEVVVGTSHQLSNSARPGVLRILSRTHVRRTNSDLVFDTRDPWFSGYVATSLEGTNRVTTVSTRQALQGILRKSFPNDIAGLDDKVEFLSAGILQITGRMQRDPRRYTGPFAQFRGTIGLSSDFRKDDRSYTSPDDNLSGDVVLLTGLDIAIAGASLQGPAVDRVTSHARLRLGSSGARVAAIQTALGVPSTSVFDQPTLAKLIDAQTNKNRWSDGILSAKSAAELGLPWHD